MSEFSESYHLRTTQKDDAVTLLRRAGIRGFVFPPANGWVTFLAEDEESKAEEHLRNANLGLLLHFDACEDHGWGFAIFNATQCVSRFRCDWTRKVIVEDAAYSAAPLDAILARQGSSSLAVLEAILRPSSFEQALEWKPDTVFARAVGLGPSAWLSFEYFAEDYQAAPQQYENVVLVE
jgi:hypothetical protein